MIVEISVRGRISASIGDTPIVRIASTSSVKLHGTELGGKGAEPERPATMIAVISTPSSRKRDAADQVDGENLGAELA